MRVESITYSTEPSELINPEDIDAMFSDYCDSMIQQLGSQIDGITSYSSTLALFEENGQEIIYKDSLEAKRADATAERLLLNLKIKARELAKKERAYELYNLFTKVSAELEKYKSKQNDLGARFFWSSADINSNAIYQSMINYLSPKLDKIKGDKYWDSSYSTSTFGGETISAG